MVKYWRNLSDKGRIQMGFLLLIPFFLIRFGLLSVLSQDAVIRAAHFPPAFRQQKGAYWIYQLSTGAILLRILLSRIYLTPLPLLYGGAVLYSMGLVLLAAAVIGFAAPLENGINRKGLYRLSRNPMYVSYFLFFLGCALLAHSPLLLLLLLPFQLTAHCLILAEERWCIQRFGRAYLQYMEQVGRYL